MLHNFLKPELAVLIPFLTGAVELLKRWLYRPGEPKGAWKAMLRLFGDRKRLPALVWALAFLICTVYGFAVSPHSGWRLALDALVFTGVLQGSVVAWAAMGVYDTCRMGRGE